jgi:hypothetical protein
MKAEFAGTLISQLDTPVLQGSLFDGSVLTDSIRQSSTKVLDAALRVSGSGGSALRQTES